MRLLTNGGESFLNRGTCGNRARLRFLVIMHAGNRRSTDSDNVVLGNMSSERKKS